MQNEIVCGWRRELLVLPGFIDMKARFYVTSENLVSETYSARSANEAAAIQTIPRLFEVWATWKALDTKTERLEVHVSLKANLFTIAVWYWSENSPEYEIVINDNTNPNPEDQSNGIFAVLARWETHKRELAERLLRRQATREATSKKRGRR